MSEEATEPTDLEIAQGILREAQKLLKDVKKQAADIKRAQKALAETPEISGPFAWHPCARKLDPMEVFVEENVEGHYVVPVFDSGSARDVRIIATGAGEFTIMALQMITLAGFLVVK